MKPDLPPVLVVDDEPNMRETVREMLNDDGFAVELAESAEQALEMMAAPGAEFFMVITDGRLGGMSGYDLIRKMAQDFPKLQVILITAFATPKLAVEAIQAGAADYLSKPFAPEELLHAVDRCRDHFELTAENKTLRARSRGSEVYEVQQIIGESPQMIELRQFIQTVGPTDSTVLILGESGTGKELVAGSIHNLSRRTDKHYIRLNCAAIPETLLESELFGHEKGAFTGALRTKPGRVEEANGGTIFLDEIGDMSRPLQAKLLRFLEDGSFTRVGGNEEKRVDVRIISATNRDIVTAIKDNEFREDLYHRLNVMKFRPPPLRDRGDDVVQLAEFFLNQHCQNLGRSKLGLSKEASQKLMRHNWPGNVRELRNVMERAAILEQTDEVLNSSLPDFEMEMRLRQSDDSGAEINLEAGFAEAVAEFERRMITAALERNQYNMNRSAEMLKMTRHSLRYRMQQLGLSMSGGTSGDDGDSE
ncbi:MAG: sigma-54-dependent Fis family transcriptional regulator [Verrucomicrobia subdivision 3 bacterium]|nr:sigma-54-dependent Fis family transcriptional regulator [Limisphaerales bacterium]